MKYSSVMDLVVGSLQTLLFPAFSVPSISLGMAAFSLMHTSNDKNSISSPYTASTGPIIRNGFAEIERTNIYESHDLKWCVYEVLTFW